MTQQSISFKSDMIRAILDDRKNNTRRLKGLKEINQHPNDWLFLEFDEYGAIFKHLPTGNTKSIRFPYGTPGETVWVRETWTRTGAGVTQYAADNKIDQPYWSSLVWKPSIHMPRWASRMDIQIINYKVERVQDITEEDAIAEGCLGYEIKPEHAGCIGCPKTYKAWRLPQVQFQDLWDSINAKAGFGWYINPWVWAISPFKRVTHP